MTRVAGLLLAAGRSRRFGREKAVARLGGRPMMAWPLAALEAACEAVAVSAVAGSGAAGFASRRRLTLLADDPRHPPGPLAGLAQGLLWARAEGFDALATLPCDTPGVTAADVAALIIAAGGSGASYAVTDGGAHGLCAVWPVGLAQNLPSRLARGDHPSVQALLEEIAANPLAFANEGAFANINTPEDFSRLSVTRSSACDR